MIASAIEISFANVFASFGSAVARLFLASTKDRFASQYLPVSI